MDLLLGLAGLVRAPEHSGMIRLGRSNSED